MAAKQYLLDTNILSELIKNPHGKLSAKIFKLSDGSFCTSILVACELRFGANKKASQNLITRVDSLLRNIDVVPMGENVDRHYAKLRCFLEEQGKPISAHDMLIAAHALALKLTLVTANEREFLRVPGLHVENWLS